MGTRDTAFGASKFKCLQQQFDLFNVANAEEVAQTAARQFENLHGLHSLKIFADAIEIETVENERARQQS